MKYIDRQYRQWLPPSRWTATEVSYRFSNLWIGTSPDCPPREVHQKVLQKLVSLHKELGRYIDRRPGFLNSLKPLSAVASGIAGRMLEAARHAGTGPMSAVAGAIAREVGWELLTTLRPKELLIENGGDIFLKNQSAVDMAVFAGPSPLSMKVGFRIPPQDSPLGICTSSGTIGPSLSFGKADAALVICPDPALADALATAMANKVKSKADIEPVLTDFYDPSLINACMLIFGEYLGVRGSYELVPVKERKYHNTCH